MGADDLKRRFLADIYTARAAEDGPVAAARAVAWWAGMLAAPGATLTEEAPAGGPPSSTPPRGHGYTVRSPQVHQCPPVQGTLFGDVLGPDEL